MELAATVWQHSTHPEFSHVGRDHTQWAGELSDHIVEDWAADKRYEPMLNDDYFLVLDEVMRHWRDFP